MTIVESVSLGALQGITEFLPVSSSAHLIVAPWFSIPIILETALYDGRHLSYAGNEGMIYLAGLLSGF